MIDHKTVMQQALESLIESARLLGATQEKISWIGYTKTDSMFESACYEIIEAKKQTILEAIAQPAHVPETDCGNIAQPVHQAEQELIDYGDARVQADRAARQADQGPCGWMQNIDTAMQEPLFGTLRGIMGTESIGQDIALLQTIRHYRAKTTWPAAKQNFCPRCGKRLGGTDDIHTCTAPAHLNLSKQTVEKLHKFLDAAAGDGVISDGVDAADLYIEIFPEQYAESAK